MDALRASADVAEDEPPAFRFITVDERGYDTSIRAKVRLSSC